MKNLYSFFLLAPALGLSSFLQAATMAMAIPVSKDASLIQKSFCCESPEDNNFGSEEIVTAGKYGQTSRALFGFDLSMAKNHKVLGAELVIQNATIVGVNPAHFTLDYTTESWDELSVSWNNQPATKFVTYLNFDAQGVSHVDVSELFLNLENADEITFAVDAIAAGNAIIPSREAANGPHVYLALSFAD